jgi:hypothetical protein
MLGLARLTVRSYADVTRNIMPSYDVLCRRYERYGGETLVEAGRRMQDALHRGAMAYVMFSVEKMTSHEPGGFEVAGGAAALP